MPVRVKRLKSYSCPEIYKNIQSTNSLMIRRGCKRPSKTHTCSVLSRDVCLAQITEGMLEAESWWPDRPLPRRAERSLVSMLYATVCTCFILAWSESQQVPRTLYDSYIPLGALIIIYHKSVIKNDRHVISYNLSNEAKRSAVDATEVIRTYCLRAASTRTLLVLPLANVDVSRTLPSQSSLRRPSNGSVGLAIDKTGFDVPGERLKTR